MSLPQYDASMNFMSELLEHVEHENEEENYADNMHTKQAYDRQYCQNDEKQDIVDDVEIITQEKSIEEENKKVIHQDAEALIKAEIKEVISKKETDRTNLIVLSEQNDSVMQQIKELQVLRDTVDQEIGELSMTAEAEKGQVENLQKRMAYNGEILGKLKGFMKTIDVGYNQLNVRHQQLLGKIANQQKKILESHLEHHRKITMLRNEISDINMRIHIKTGNVGSAADDPVKNRNMALKAKVIELQDYLSQLKMRCSEKELQKEKISQLKNKKTTLELSLKGKQEDLQKSRELNKQKKASMEKLLRELEIEKEEKNKRLNESLQILDNINKDNEGAVADQEKLGDILLRKEEYSIKLDEKVTKVATDLKDKQAALAEESERCHQDTDTAHAKLKKSENDLATITNENHQLSSCLDMMKLQYMSKLEEKSDKLLLKSEIGNKVRSEEILLAKIKILEEEIQLKMKTPDELLQKIEQLSSDNSTQNFKKEKAYLISSRDYLSEKLENMKKQSENLKTTLEDLQKELLGNVSSNRVKQEKCDGLKDQLLELKSKAVAELGNNNPPSILKMKSPLTHRKNTPMSPKKVQFQGLSSYESSVSSDAIQLSGSTSIVGKTFDEIWNEIQNESIKEPVKVPKKRIVQLE